MYLFERKVASFVNNRREKRLIIDEMNDFTQIKVILTNIVFNNMKSISMIVNMFTLAEHFKQAAKLYINTISQNGFDSPFIRFLTVQT